MTQIADDELIVTAHIPVPEPVPSRATRTAWRKVGTPARPVDLQGHGRGRDRARRRCRVDARIALGAVADRSIRAFAAEAAVRRLRLSDASDAVRAAVASAIHPIDDVRSMASYRREVAANLVARFFDR